MRRRWMLSAMWCAWVMGLLLGTTAAATGQESAAGDAPLTTLTVSTRVVEISAVVKGKDGAPRGGLTKDDFVLKQDGKEEPIHYFSQGADLPLTMALLVDTSGSQRTFLGDESLASDVFFEAMLGRKEDRAMLVEFDTKVLRLQGLTSSAGPLHVALQGLALHEDPMRGTLLRDAVFAVTKNYLASETGRKAIVLLTDGEDFGSRVPLEQVIEGAQRANVQIYSVSYSAWTPNLAPLGGYMRGSSSPVETGDPGLKVLQRLSEATGGQVFSVSRTTSLREIYARIAQDLRLQYEVGYTPPPAVQPNSYHTLELKAKDKHLQVLARKGFFAKP